MVLGQRCCSVWSSLSVSKCTVRDPSGSRSALYSETRLTPPPHAYLARPALTPTSTSKEIYSQVSSLKELRHHTTVLEAILAEQKTDGGRGADESKDDNPGDSHSTCFKLCQAVRSLKKRDNKKEKKERLYSTLDDAFNTHRLKILSGATATNRRRIGSLQRALPVPASATIVSASSPSPLTLPVGAVVQQCVSDAASSTAEVNDVVCNALATQQCGLHQSQDTMHPLQRPQQQQSQRHGAHGHAEADVLRPAVCTQCLRDGLRRTGRLGEMDTLLRQLSDGTSRMQSQLTTFEEESTLLRTQLKSCHKLLNTWVLYAAEESIPTCAQPLEHPILSTDSSPCLASSSGVSAAQRGASSSAVDAAPSACDAPPPSPSSNTGERSPSGVEMAMEIQHHEDPSLSTTASSSRHDMEDACVSQTDIQLATRGEDGDEGIDGPRTLGSPKDAESGGDAHQHITQQKKSLLRRGRFVPQATGSGACIQW